MILSYCILHFLEYSFFFLRPTPVSDTRSFCVVSSAAENVVCEKMGVVRGERLRVRVVPRGKREARVVSARRRGRPPVDVPRSQRALRQRPHTGHPGERRGRVAPVHAAREHGAGRPVRGAGQPLAVETPRRPQVEGRVESGRGTGSRVHARSATRTGSVREIRHFQDER